MQKGHSQPFSHKFSQKNNDGVFINLILYDWMTPLDEFSRFTLYVPIVGLGQTCYYDGARNFFYGEPRYIYI